MTRSIVHADAIITMDANNLVIQNGAVIVDGSRIEAVGLADDLSQLGPFDRELGGRGFVLLPGLVTAHHHTATFLRGSYEWVPFEQREPVNLYADLWDEEELYWLNLYTNLQLLRAGTTTAITFFYGLNNQPDLGCEPVIRAFLDSGIRAALGIAARDRWDIVHARDEREFLDRLPPELGERVRQSPFGYRYDTDQIENLTRRLAARYQDAQGRFRIFTCPDWTPSSTDELYERMKRLARELDTGILIHLLECPYEMLHSFRTYGKSAVARLADLQFLGPEVTCTDCVWLTQDDLRIMADTGATAVYTPRQIAGFNGIAPVREMLDVGVRVAFGVWRHSYNDGYDALSDLGIAENLQHRPHIPGGALSAHDVLRMATVNGGAAWALDDSLGILAAGKRADLVLLEKSHLFDDPFLDPSLDLHRLIVYRGRGVDVHTVMVEGQVLVENHRCLIADEEEAFRRAQEGVQRIMRDRAGTPKKWFDLARELEPYMIDYYREWNLRAALSPRDAYNTEGISL